MTNLNAVTDFANATMRGVVASRVVNKDNIDLALDVMRTEIKDFFTGETYVDERAAVLAGTIHQGYVLASVVASCILKIKEESA